MAEIEGRIQKEWGNFDFYDPFMDYNAAFWTEVLDGYISEYKANDVKFLALKWTSDDDKDYYSIVASPCGYVVIEIMSDTVPSEYESLF